MKVCYGQHMWTRRCIISTQPIYSTYYSAIRAYSKKNGWKLASPAEDRYGGRAIGSLFGICGSVLRVLEDDCLDNGRDDDASPELDLDILKLSVYKWHIKWVTKSLIQDTTLCPEKSGPHKFVLISSKIQNFIQLSSSSINKRLISIKWPLFEIIRLTVIKILAIINWYSKIAVSNIVYLLTSILLTLTSTLTHFSLYQNSMVISTYSTARVCERWRWTFWPPFVTVIALQTIHWV